MASSRNSKKTMEQYMRTGDKVRVASGAELENPVLPNKGRLSLLRMTMGFTWVGHMVAPVMFLNDEIW